MAPRQYHNISPTTVGYGCNASLASSASASASTSTSASSSSPPSSSSLTHGSPRNFDPTGHHDAQTPANANANANAKPNATATANANGDNRSLSTSTPTPTSTPISTLTPTPPPSDRAWRQKLLTVLQTVCQSKTVRYGTAAGMILAAIAYAMRPPPNGNHRKWTRMRMRTLSLLSMVARLGTGTLGAIANPTNAAPATSTSTTSTLPSTFPTTATLPTTTRSTGLAQFCSALCAALVRLLKSPDYAHADSASLGWLKSAAERGLVQKALIGATHILVRVRTHHDNIHNNNNNNNNNGSSISSWKKTALPPQSEGLKSDLVELLSKGGCQEIAALPDTFWDRAATPLLTALPFLYLALAYRMLKGLQTGNLDGEDFFSSKLLNNNNSNNNNDDEQRTRTRTRTGITLDDVAGLDTILPEVREIVSYLRDPSGFVVLGAELPRGILLHGSPGVGKTMIARAIAGEADCDAFCVCSGSDFCEVYVGRGAGRVRTLFREARATALKNYRHRQRQRGMGKRRWPWPWALWQTMGSASDNNNNNHNNNNNSNNNDSHHRRHRHQCRRPPTAIIFIDELDAVAKSRSYGGAANGNDERDQTLNQLLTEMDGFFRDNTNNTNMNANMNMNATHRSRSRRRRRDLKFDYYNDDCDSNYDDSNYNDYNDSDSVTTIVIAATNRAELLDPAILRRFDRHIKVPHPDTKGRADILRVHARAKTTNCRFSTIHWDHLAEETPGFSGSDLRQVVNDAALLAVRQRSKHIEQGHLLQAIQRARATRVHQNGSSGYIGNIGNIGSSHRGLGSYPASSMLPFVYR